MIEKYSVPLVMCSGIACLQSAQKARQRFLEHTLLFAFGQFWAFNVPAIYFSGTVLEIYLLRKFGFELDQVKTRL